MLYIASSIVSQEIELEGMNDPLKKLCKVVELDTNKLVTQLFYLFIYYFLLLLLFTHTPHMA